VVSGGSNPAAQKLGRNGPAQDQKNTFIHYWQKDSSSPPFPRHEKHAIAKVGRTNVRRHLPAEESKAMSEPCEFRADCGFVAAYEHTGHPKAERLIAAWCDDLDAAVNCPRRLVRRIYDAEIDPAIAPNGTELAAWAGPSTARSQGGPPAAKGRPPLGTPVR